ncbi:replication protein C [Rhodobacterales bacterium]|nr:replication protein C [Rhodobacterales bacterium]
MPAVSNVSSFRKVTPGILASQRLAMSNDIPDVGKSEVAITLKRASQPLGLTSTAYHVLDILLGLSKAEDWQGDARPVVAISNEKLASYVGRSERTIVRAVRQLVEARILAYRDSSTGRRWVHRNNAGEITHAYGLDFTPARVRYREIRKLADAWQADLNAEREAKRTVASVSRSIVDIVDASPIDAELDDFLDRMTAILESNETIREKAASLQDLYDLLVEAVTEANAQSAQSTKNDQTTGERDSSVTQLYNTSSPDSCSSIRPSANADEFDPKTNDAYGAEIAPEKEQAERAWVNSGARGAENHDETTRNAPVGTLDAISISLLESACKSVQSDFGLTFKSWPELISAAEVMRIGIGLSSSAYTAACGRLGREAAAAILAVVTEKSLRDPEKISSPGGYFRACCDRAADGKLALARSLFGLAASS